MNKFSWSISRIFLYSFISVALALRKHELKSEEILSEHVVLEDKDGLKINDMRMIHQWKHCNEFAIHLKGDIFRTNTKIVAQVSENHTEKFCPFKITWFLQLTRNFLRDWHEIP